MESKISQEEDPAQRQGEKLTEDAAVTVCSKVSKGHALKAQWPADGLCCVSSPWCSNLLIGTKVNGLLRSCRNCRSVDERKYIIDYVFWEAEDPEM